MRFVFGNLVLVSFHFFLPPPLQYKLNVKTQIPNSGTWIICFCTVVFVFVLPRASFSQFYLVLKPISLSPFNFLHQLRPRSSWVIEKNGNSTKSWHSWHRSFVKLFSVGGTTPRMLVERILAGLVGWIEIWGVTCCPMFLATNSSSRMKSTCQKFNLSIRRV